MWQGYTSEGVAKQGRPAAQAVLLAYFECVSFLVVMYICNIIIAASS